MINNINNNINFSANAINNVKQACTELSSKIGKDTHPNVSFDVVELNGKAFLSVQQLLTNRNKGLFLKLVKGKDSASSIIAVGDDDKLKRIIPKSEEFVRAKLKELVSVMKKADTNEAKSLTDF